MAEPEEPDPGQRPFTALLTADVIRRARGVHHPGQVELAALERSGGLVSGGPRDLDPSDIPGMCARVGLVVGENEAPVAALQLAKRPADDLALGIHPIVAIALDRVPGSGARIR